MFQTVFKTNTITVYQGFDLVNNPADATKLSDSVLLAQASPFANQDIDIYSIDLLLNYYIAPSPPNNNVTPNTAGMAIDILPNIIYSLSKQPAHKELIVSADSVAFSHSHIILDNLKIQQSNTVPAISGYQGQISNKYNENGLVLQQLLYGQNLWFNLAMTSVANATNPFVTIYATAKINWLPSKPIAKAG
jgi:hypothetical protein